ncbi:kelch protein [Anaeramoeba flamelloides]|uniref:Kelch protein n=1 Tax=Anaeramoeba flamelloides TaxID=1746091 RepID=A0ABQ8XIK9_9EUKA|nr:kelch protein [Anaeramoeba flamelloides]
MSIEEYLKKGNFQQCPYCKSVEKIFFIGCGFHVCTICSNLFCIYCCYQIKDQKEGFYHYCLFHKGKEKSKIELRNLNQIKKDLEVITVGLKSFGKILPFTIHSTLSWDAFDKLVNLQEEISMVLYGQNVSRNNTVRELGIKNGSIIKTHPQLCLNLYTSYYYFCSLSNQKRRSIQKQEFMDLLFPEETLKDFLQEKLLLKLKIKTTENEKKEEKEGQTEKLFIVHEGIVHNCSHEVFKLSQLNPFYVITESTLYKYGKHISSLNRDFIYLLKNKEMTNFKIQGIPVHSELIFCRTGVKANTINSIFEKKTIKPQQINQFLDWVYGSDWLFNEKNIQDLLNLIGSTKLRKNKEQEQNLLSQDLELLFLDLNNKNENKKKKLHDFIIEAYPNRETETETETEKTKETKETEKEKKQKNIKEIYCNKFVLLARSRLFRELFLNIEPNMHKMKDPKKLSFTSLQHFYKFLYTNNINRNGLNKNEKESLFQEFEELMDFYQFNNNCRLL